METEEERRKERERGRQESHTAVNEPPPPPTPERGLHVRTYLRWLCYLRTYVRRYVSTYREEGRPTAYRSSIGESALLSARCVAHCDGNDNGSRCPGAHVVCTRASSETPGHGDFPHVPLSIPLPRSSASSPSSPPPLLLFLRHFHRLRLLLLLPFFRVFLVLRWFLFLPRRARRVCRVRSR